MLAELSTSLKPCSMGMYSVAGQAALGCGTTAAKSCSCLWEHLTMMRVDLRRQRGVERIL